jgi:transposase
MVLGTSSEKIIELLQRIPISLRNKVEEITLDIAASMNLIAKRCFPNATLVTDRFHIQKLAIDAVQELRIKHRWEAIDAENEAVEKARNQKKGYHPTILDNGDTVKQLLARSRYALYKNQKNWTADQKQRTQILFVLYPDSASAYQLAQQLNWIFENTKEKIYGYTRLAQWHEKVTKSGFKSFNTIARTTINH